MLGFISPKSRKSTTPISFRPVQPPPETEEVVLITLEDIYRASPERGQEPILLLKKGYEVPADELPRFLQNGADPSQFEIKLRDTLPAQSQTNPITIPPALSKAKQLSVIVFDANPKSMKRMIDCLFFCGINLSNIHPVRALTQLTWSLNKHKPELLVLDFTSLDLAHRKLFRKVLEKLPPVSKIIVSVEKHDAASQFNKSFILELVQDTRVEVLEKPVSRFTLNRLLES